MTSPADTPELLPPLESAVPSVMARVEVAAARGLFRLPSGLQFLLSGSAPSVVDGRRLDPQMQLLLSLRRKRGGRDLLRGETAEAARRAVRRETLRYAQTDVPLASVRDLWMPTHAGRLRARHYVPRGGEGRPLVVFLHGGGFVVGDLDTHDEPCRLLSRAARVHVLSVDYRLAPEHPFPAAVEDTVASLEWAFRHASWLGADPERVAIGGDSAGGCLSAVAAQEAAAGGGRAPAAQLLVYPFTDAVQPHPSRTLFCEGYGLTARDMAWADENYVDAAHVDRTDPRVSPLRAPSLRGLCPAVVVTAGFDPLRDEGNAYAAALAAAGNEVVHLEHEGLVHGFINMLSLSSSAMNAWLSAAEALRALLDRKA